LIGSGLAETVSPSLEKEGTPINEKEQWTTISTQENSVHPIFNRLRKLLSFDHYAFNDQMQDWWQGFAKYLYKLHDQEHRLAKVFRRYLKSLIGSALLLLFFTLVGLNAPATYPPLFIIVHRYETASIIVIMLLSLYVVRVLLVGTQLEQTGGERPGVSKGQYSSPLLFLNVTSYMGSSALLFVLLLLLIRPVWCPNAICPTPQRVLIFHPQSIHDNNLEMYVIANQSTFYAIPGDPAQYK
jgi:hypothetical protein